jgi:hypothetical protein
LVWLQCVSAFVLTMIQRPVLCNTSHAASASPIPADASAVALRIGVDPCAADVWTIHTWDVR